MEALSVCSATAALLLINISAAQPSTSARAGVGIARPGDVLGGLLLECLDMAVMSWGARGRGMLPEGTVTFLLTDVEGSTRLWEREPASAGQMIARHYDLLDAA